MDTVQTVIVQTVEVAVSGHFLNVLLQTICQLVTLLCIGPGSVYEISEAKWRCQ